MEDKSRNRGVGRGADNAIKALVCGRSNGKGLRTFHAKFRSMNKGAGGAKKARRSLVYMDRLEAFEKRDDLVATGGRSREDMEGIIEALDASAAIDRDRVVTGFHLELDSRLPMQAQIRVMTGLENATEQAGFPCHWAIHGKPQPHAHGAVGVRPVHQGEDGTWMADPPGRRGRPAHSFLPDAKAVKQWRQVVCDLVNAELDREGITGDRWDPRGFRELGIDREPKKRLPLGAYHRIGQRERDPAAVKATRTAHEAQRAESTRKRQEAAQRRQERLARAIQEAGQVLVAPAVLTALEAAATRPSEVREVIRTVERPIRPPSPTLARIMDEWVEQGIRVPPELRQDGDAAGHAIRLAGELWKAGNKEARQEAAQQAAEAVRRRQEAEKRAEALEGQILQLTAALEREREKRAAAMRSARTAKSSPEPSPSPPSPSKGRGGPSW